LLSDGSAIEFKGVHKSYGSTQVLKDFYLSIPSGKIITLIGPSGCGKTTILKMINKLIEPDLGTILVEGKEVSQMDPVELRRSIGYVIQQIGLFPHLTIEDNITLVPRLKGKKKKSLIDKSKQLLQLIGMEYETFRHRYPHELSGGQQQRIGVARALAADPSIILMDEPFSALDPISRIQLQNELMKLNQSLKKTIVFVTHDIDEALKIADVVVLLKDGEIVQVSTPDVLLEKPANDFVRHFVGEHHFRTSKVPIEPDQKAADLLPQSLLIGHDDLLSTAVSRMNQHSCEMLIVTDKTDGYRGVVHLSDVKSALKSESDGTIERVIDTEYPVVMEKIAAEEIFALLMKHSLIPVLDEGQQLIRVIVRENVLNELTHVVNREEVTV
jgi:osmoprotectant transport system ATP-binding protein